MYKGDDLVTRNFYLSLLEPVWQNEADSKFSFSLWNSFNISLSIITVIDTKSDLLPYEMFRCNYEEMLEAILFTLNGTVSYLI